MNTLIKIPTGKVGDVEKRTFYSYENEAREVRAFRYRGTFYVRIDSMDQKPARLEFNRAGDNTIWTLGRVYYTPEAAIQNDRTCCYDAATMGSTNYMMVDVRSFMKQNGIGVHEDSYGDCCWVVYYINSRNEISHERIVGGAVKLRISEKGTILDIFGAKAALDNVRERLKLDKSAKLFATKEEALKELKSFVKIIDFDDNAPSEKDLKKREKLLNDIKKVDEKLKKLKSQL